MQILNPTLTHGDDRSHLRLERRFAHPPAKVWRALTEPAQLNQWFPFDVEIELRLGSKVNFIEKGAHEPSSEGEITELDPPHLLAFTWYGDLLHWELQPDGDGCRLIFTHTFGDRAGAASFAAGWQVCLDAMSEVLGGRPIDEGAYAGPEWRRQMAELHEAYVDALGLSTGAAETTADGWQVRFERQLTKPIDEVWARLTRGSTPSAGSAPPNGFTTGAIQAGLVTAGEAPNWLEYEWQVADRPAGRVRWELAQGTGHGARLILTQTGAPETGDQQTAALAAWQSCIEHFAKGLADE